MLLLVLLWLVVVLLLWLVVVAVVVIVIVVCLRLTTSVLAWAQAQWKAQRFRFAEKSLSTLRMADVSKLLQEYHNIHQTVARLEQHLSESNASRM